MRRDRVAIYKVKIKLILVYRQSLTYRKIERKEIEQER